jgi:hypothetical protein
MVKSRWVFLLVGLVLGVGLAHNGGALLAADAPPARVFEIRTYHTFPGRLEALHQRFRDHTRRVFEKHGMTNVGYWVPQDDPAHQDTLVYIISHASREQAKANWAAFMADPEWKKISDDSQKDGKIVAKVELLFVDATDYSHIK